MVTQIIMKTLILGMSIGGGCIAHCGTVLLPLLLCETRRRWYLAVLFLGARFFGYLLFALVSFYAGSLLANLSYDRGLMEGGLFLLLGFLLARYALRLRDTLDCSSGCGKRDSVNFELFRKSGKNYAIQAGFLTGLSLCTPFLAVLTESLHKGSFLAVLGAFFWFYLGTTIILLPILVGGILSRGIVIRQIGLLCGMLAAVIYFFQGAILLIGGIYGNL